ncbi:MAG: site-specific integrase, partial [Desulfobacterales bacterium]
MACARKRRNRWVIDFYDQDGKRRWLTLPVGTTKNEANEKLGEIEKKVRRGIFKPVKALPVFSEVADSWLASKKAHIRHSTYKQYQGHVKIHLKPYFGKLKINHVGFDCIEKFKAHSLAKGVTPPTLRKILINLGAILTYSVRMRYIDYNPAREVEKPKGRSTIDEMVILKPRQIRALLKNTGDQKARVLFMTAVLTGMRQGELLGLQWGDIDWTDCQIHVRRTYNHGHFYEPKSKTSRRKIDMPPELVLELTRWKTACPISDLDLVFPTGKGTPQSAPAMLYRQFFPALQRTGLPRIRFHNLRHTYASLLIDQGEHPKYIQSQLGHSSIQVTMDIYGHLMDTVNRGAAIRLGRAVLGNSEA